MQHKNAYYIGRMCGKNMYKRCIKMKKNKQTKSQGGKKSKTCTFETGREGKRADPSMTTIYLN